MALRDSMPPGCPWAVSCAVKPLARLRFAASLGDAQRLAGRLWPYGKASAEHALSGERWERERRCWRRVAAGALPAPAAEDERVPWWIET